MGLWSRLRVSHWRLRGERWLLNWVSGVHGVGHHAHRRHGAHGWPLRVAHAGLCLVRDRARRCLHVAGGCRGALCNGGWRRERLGWSRHPSFQIRGHLRRELGRVRRAHLALALAGVTHRPCRRRRDLPDGSIGLHGIGRYGVHGLCLAGHRGCPGHRGAWRDSCWYVPRIPDIRREVHHLALARGHRG